jgi:hypothetical protein
MKQKKIRASLTELRLWYCSTQEPEPEKHEILVPAAWVVSGRGEKRKWLR